MNQSINCNLLFFLFALLLFALTTYAQTKSKDIDVLYQKYKNRDTISVTNAKGMVKLAVDITLNSNGKPQSIILKGYADNATL